MKKIIAAFLCGLLLLTLAACGGGEKVGDTMSAEEILNGLYEGAGEDELPMGLMTVLAEGEMFEYFFFIPEVAGAEAWVSRKRRCHGFSSRSLQLNWKDQTATPISS